MASVDWKKLKTGGMRHLAVHFQQELRETRDHSNRNINKELTKNNITFGVKDFYEACDKLEARVKEVDEKYPPKRKVEPKERVVGCSLNIVCPAEIASMGMDKVKEYFEKSYKAMENYFGKDNVCGGFVHLDETHSYKDAETKEDRESLFHMNVFLPAFVDEEVTIKPTKKNPSGKSHIIGINGKHFQSRKHMNEVNDIMETVCHEYGIHWHTGKGKNHETIETLKAKSAEVKREIEEQKLTEIQGKIEHNRNIGNKEIEEIKKVQKDIVSAKSELEEVNKEKDIAKSELEDLKKDIDSAKRIRSRETMSVLERIRFYLDRYLDTTPNDKSFLHKFINMFESWDRRELQKGQIWKSEQGKKNTVIKEKGEDLER